MAYQYTPYEESDAVRQYRRQLEELLTQKPGEYASQWQAAQQKAANALLNRDKFQYNMSSDPLYQQYKEQYQRQGKLAMQDTVGQAAAMNGGYGSSYGQMAGQQVYNSNLQQLNEKVPELYQLALEKYQMEGQEAMDRFNLVSAMENQDYSRYQDKLSNWQTERAYATDRYDTERSTDYNLWADQDQREYSRYQDQQQLAAAQVDYLLSIGVTPNAELLEMAGYNSQYVTEAIKQAKAAAAAAYSGGSGNTLVKQVNDALKNGMDPKIASQTLVNMYKTGDITAKEYSDTYKQTIGKIEQNIVRVPGGGVVNGVLKTKK